MMEIYDWDITQAAACLLGQRARHIAVLNTAQAIQVLDNDEQGGLNLDLLGEEMCTHIENEFERKRQLLSAFIDGFNH